MKRGYRNTQNKKYRTATEQVGWREKPTCPDIQDLSGMIKSKKQTSDKHIELAKTTMDQEH